MDEGLKQRLVGAVVLVLLAVIFIPMLFDSSPEPERADVDPGTSPGGEGEFSSRIVPLEEPRSEAQGEVAMAEPGLHDGDEADGTEEASPSGEGAGVPTRTERRSASPPEEANAAGEAAGTLSVSSAAAEPPGAGEVPAVQEEDPVPVEVRTGAEEGAAAGWAAQLGSFADRRNAFVLRNRLRAKGYAAFTQSVTGDQGEVTRVLVGPEPTRDRTLSTIEALRRDTGLDAFVVRYPRG